MVAAQHWPGLALVIGELEQLPRRQAFQIAHPDAEFSRAGPAFLGHVPYTDDGMARSITVRGASWGIVMDTLEGYFNGHAPDTG